MSETMNNISNNDVPMSDVNFDEWIMDMGSDEPADDAQPYIAPAGLTVTIDALRNAITNQDEGAWQGTLTAYQEFRSTHQPPITENDVAAAVHQSSRELTDRNVDTIRSQDLSIRNALNLDDPATADTPWLAELPPPQPQQIPVAYANILAAPAEEADRHAHLQDVYLPPVAAESDSDTNMPLAPPPAPAPANFPNLLHTYLTENSRPIDPLHPERSQRATISCGARNLYNHFGALNGVEAHFRQQVEPAQVQQVSPRQQARSHIVLEMANELRERVPLAVRDDGTPRVRRVRVVVEEWDDGGDGEPRDREGVERWEWGEEEHVARGFL